MREGWFSCAAWIAAQQWAFGWSNVEERGTLGLTYAVPLCELAHALQVQIGMSQPQDEQERRLASALAAATTLVVVENLETSADVPSLREGLNQLARLTKSVG